MRLVLNAKDAFRTWTALSTIDDIVRWDCYFSGEATEESGLTDSAFRGTVLGFSDDGSRFRAVCDGEESVCLCNDDLRFWYTVTDR